MRFHLTYEGSLYGWGRMSSEQGFLKLKAATPIGRASTMGRSVLWQPGERMGLRDRARHE
jgi:hypothetical protein